MIVDRELMHRIEAAMVAERSAFADGMAALQPHLGANWLDVAGGRAIFTGAITPDIKECNQNRFHQAPFPHLTHRLALNQFPNIFFQIVSHV